MNTTDANKIWDESYNARQVEINIYSSVGIITAIHTDIDGSLVEIGEIKVCAGSAGAVAYTCINLSPEQMEALAAHLLDGAKALRELQARVSILNAGTTQ